MKASVCVSIDTEVEVDLSQFDEDDLIAELKSRGLRMPEKRGSSGYDPVLAIFEEFHRRGDAPKVLSDYLYETIGRVLP